MSVVILMSCGSSNSSASADSTSIAVDSVIATDTTSVVDLIQPISDSVAKIPDTIQK